MYVPLRIYDKTYGIKSDYQKFFKAMGIALVGLVPNSGLDYSGLIQNSLGLFLPGGGDLDPRLYNVERSTVFDPEIDRGEQKLYRYARKEGHKIFGICRGIQALNVFEGGTLKRVLNHEKTEHSISYRGRERLVNSFHHEAIDKLASSLKTVAASRDGTVEIAISHDKKALGFQFHPEKTAKDERRYWIKEVARFLYSDR